MTHRQVLEALSGLLLAMFVAMLSSTVVSNALPRSSPTSSGSQTGYTWVVTATLLTMTATTPIWGKLADLFSKKLLVQIALVIFVARLAARRLLASTPALLIGCARAPGPRRRRPAPRWSRSSSPRWSPRASAAATPATSARVFALATVGGPLLGGSSSTPLARLALVLLRRPARSPSSRSSCSRRRCTCRSTQARGAHRLPRRHPARRRRLAPADLGLPRRRPASTGSPPQTGARRRRRASWRSLAVRGRRAPGRSEPIIPLRLFRDRTTTPGHRRQRRRRRRDVRRRRSSSASTSSSPAA